MHHAFLELFKAEYAYDMGMPQGLARIDHPLSALRLERLFLGRTRFVISGSGTGMRSRGMSGERA